MQQVTLRPQFSSVMTQQPRPVQQSKVGQVTFSSEKTLGGLIGPPRSPLILGVLLALMSLPAWAPGVSGYFSKKTDPNQPEIQRFNRLDQSLEALTLTQNQSAQERVLLEVLSLKPGEALELRKKSPIADKLRPYDGTPVLKSRAVEYIPNMPADAQMRLVTVALQDENLHDKLLAVSTGKNELALSLAAKELIFETLSL